MEKFSLYELLSFIAPGVAAIFLFNSYSQYVLGWHFVDFGALNFYESIQYLLLALFMGISIHLISIYLTENKIKFFSWYQKLAHQPIKEIVRKDPFLLNIMPCLEANYKRINKSKNLEPELHLLFGTAYYFLETNSKIDAPKSFQGLYFWMRNVTTLILIAFLLFLIVLILGAVKVFLYFNSCNAIIFLIVLPIGFLLLTKPTQWLRRKMVSRIFISYYSYLIHEQKKD